MDVDSEMKREDDDGRKERRSERDKRDKDRDSRRDRSREFNTEYTSPALLLTLFPSLFKARRRSETFADDERRGDVRVILVMRMFIFNPN
jgi:hypothetical protein